MATAFTPTLEASNVHSLAELNRPLSKPGEPTWELALDFPYQGEWTEAEYLRLGSNRLVEFFDGTLEFLPMPTYFHQSIVEFLYSLFKPFVEQRRLGKVRFAPLPVRLWPGKYREPDLLYLSNARIPQDPHSQPEGADLVAEVVSPGDENRERDLVTKPQEYARAGIQEYWIIDPETRSIKVLVLDGAAYRLHGEFTAGQTATSFLLDGLSVNVDDVFAAGEGGP
jgi:Uma2 family endonuclease